MEALFGSPKGVPEGDLSVRGSAFLTLLLPCRSGPDRTLFKSISLVSRCPSANYLTFANDLHGQFEGRLFEGNSRRRRWKCQEICEWSSVHSAISDYSPK